jgi:dolichol-phosphate mannosyltransferase
MSLTILIPIKNEEKGILDTLKYFEESWVINMDHEIILIDDFSTDNTYEEIKKFQSSKLNYKIIKNKRKGLGSAMIVGIENSSKEFIAIFMADLSDSLEDLKRYYNSIKENKLNAVFGSRFIKGSIVTNYPMAKYYMNRIANNIIKIIFFSNYNDYTNAFKIYERKTLLELFPLVSENFNIFLELPLKIISRKYNYKIIPISWKGRVTGISKFNIRELGSKYIFTLLYCLLEKILLKK